MRNCSLLVILTLLPCIVIAVFVEEAVIEDLRRQPKPATLRVGDQEQRGSISAVCWPGWGENEECVDICAALCAPADPVIAAANMSAEIDFSAIGRPHSVTYTIHAPSSNQVYLEDGEIKARRLAEPLAIIDQGEASHRTDTVLSIPLDLPPGNYLVQVSASFDTGGYAQGFHVRIPEGEAHDGL